MKQSGFGKHKIVSFFAGKGFYAALALCLVGAGATAWIAADRTLSGLEEQNRLISQQQPQTVVEEEFVWETPQTPVQEIVEEQPKPSSSPSPSSNSSSLPEESQEPAEPSVQPAASPVQSTSEFVLPVRGAVFNRFSEGKLVRNETLKDWRTHNGVDFAADKNEDVVAIQTGTVSSVRKDALWGWVVEIDHGSGLRSVTCGLGEKLPVSEGEWVSAGQVIGRAGIVPCESSLQSHIHLEVYQHGVAVDPLKAMGKM
ncbi:MAG: M23 family metallopeptidase [Oscillospiraceae bacterium]|nr:M23 family metallopeptidase [Oscillospiraceae bacterium]